MFPEISLLFEVLVAGMLAVMIYYAWRLNRTLGTLQNDKAELEKLLATFHEATERAETGVARLKESATETARSLDERVAKAVTLRDELAFMVERANEIADRLEQGISAGRHAAGSAPSAAARQPQATAPANASGASGASGAAAGSAAYADGGNTNSGRDDSAAGDGKAMVRAAEHSPAAAEPDQRRSKKSDLLKALEGMR